MTRRQLELPDERFELMFQLYCLRAAFPLIGFGRSQTIDAFSEFLCRPHAVCHRIDERINAAADVLQIDDEGVDVFHHLLGRHPRFAVERIDHDARSLIGSVRRFDHVVLQVAANSVLRAEKSRQIKIRVSMKCICRMNKTTGQHRRLIADEADPLALDKADFSSRRISTPSRRSAVV